jgi:hypothetical protein
MEPTPVLPSGAGTAAAVAFLVLLPTFIGAVYAIIRERRRPGGGSPGAWTVLFLLLGPVGVIGYFLFRPTHAGLARHAPSLRSSVDSVPDRSV